MKSIVYILIAVFTCSIVFTGLPKLNANTPQSVTIQCVDENTSNSELYSSAEILKLRMREYGLNKFEITINSTNSTLEINTTDKIKSRILIDMLTAPGRIEFYEVYTISDVINMLGDGNELFSLLNKPRQTTQIIQFSGILGYCKADKKSDVDQYLRSQSVSSSGSEINFFWSELPNAEGDYNLFALSPKAAMDNTNIFDSKVTKKASGRNPGLMIFFDESGKLLWKDLTQKNVGKSIAIVLDGKVLMSPMVQMEIKEGKALITGNFTMDELNRIKSLINNDVLTLHLEVKN